MTDDDAKALIASLTIPPGWGASAGNDGTGAYILITAPDGWTAQFSGDPPLQTVQDLIDTHLADTQGA